MQDSIIYICILVHNAPKYVWKTLNSICKYTKKDLKGSGVNFKVKIMVLDNASKIKTRTLLLFCKLFRYINKLHFSSENLLFAGGNNKLVSTLPRPNSQDYVLLLNSDIEVKNGEWLENLLKLMNEDIGAVSYGACLNDPIRADGYCILIRRKLFDKYMMDESFQWFWSMTKLEANILSDGYNIIAIKDHEDMLHHFGGKSGTSWQGAKGMDVEMDDVLSWFDGSSSSGKVIVR